MSSNSNKENTGKYLLSRTEVAELFGVSTSTIDRWRAEHLLPFIKVGKGRGKNKTIRYPSDKILKFIEDHTVATKPELMEKYGLD